MARRAHRVRTMLHTKAMILVYHRVAQAKVDPWALGVTPEHFAQQLDVLRTTADPVSLEELARAKSDRDLPPRPVCVTFDDGYADNLLAAKPILESYGVPATVFITPGYLGVRGNLWWDELAKLVLDPDTRKPELSLELNGKRVVYVFPPDAEPGALDTECKWRAWDEAPGPRQSAYLALWEMLSKLPDAARDRAMEELRLGAAPYDNGQHRCLTEEEVRELAEGDLVAIGAHTLTHPVLAGLPVEQQQHEIGGSRQRLEALTGKSIRCFAYPYGKKIHYTRRTVAVVRASGFACACSNFGGLVTRTSDRFTLPRFQPMDWEGDRFADVVAGWRRG